MAEIKCVSSYFFETTKCVSSFFFEATESTLDCSYNRHLVDACIEAETAERFCQKNQEAFFDSALYQAVEDFENILQVGRGIKRQADNIIENEKKRKHADEEPSTSNNLQPSTPSSSSEEDLAECDVCNIKVKKRYLTNHYRSNLHKTNALRIHHQFPNVQLLETAFGKRIHTYRVKPLDENSLLFDLFFSSIRDILITLIKDSIVLLKNCKVNFILHAKFIHQSKELINTFDFQTKNYILNQSDDIDDFLTKLQETLDQKISEFEKKDSGWTVQNILNIDVNVNKFNPLNGSSYIDLPHDIKNKKAVINVKNSDFQCFKWALLSALYPVNKSSDRVQSYTQHQNKLNFKGITFPVKLTDIHKIEKLNNLSINVYGLEYNPTTRKNTVIGPLYFSKSIKPTHINLLYLTNKTNAHYCFIKSLSRLVLRQVSLRNDPIYICDGCLVHFTKKESLDRHREFDCSHICTNIPKENENKKNWFGENVPTNRLQFDNFDKKMRVPFVIYADFESFLNPIESCANDPNKSYTTNIQRHDVYSFGYFIKCSYDDRKSKYVTYTGENCATVFMKKIYEDIEMICKENSFHKCPLPLTKENHININETSICYICDTELDSNRHIDYCWHTGAYMGVSHKICSDKYHKVPFVPIILHNLSNYDAHFIVHALNFMDGEVQIIPQNKEKYISFSKNINIKGKSISLRFIDSLKFLPGSLESLAKNLNDNQFCELRKEYPKDEDFKLLKRKGVYPYDHINGFEKLNLRNLPSIENFNSILTGSGISVEEYNHALNVWSHFQCQTMLNYSDLYLKTDVLLLADIFENFRNVCLKTYDLDPAHYYTAPGLSWDAMLKCTQVELELLTDIDKIAFIKSGIRGGISQCSNRYAKANNQYMTDFDKNQPTSYLTYLDANNLYGWAMSQYLPLSDFEWVDPNKVNYNVPITSEVGYILELDLEYPNNLHDAHSDFPLCPENICIDQSKESKLVPNLQNKTKYVIHYRNVLQAEKLGMNVTKIHRVLKFKQTPWLKKYIDLNTRLRTAAKSEFEKDFYKLMNNSVFGKTMENIEKRVNVKLLTHWEDHGKIKGVQSLIAHPGFHNLCIFSESLVAVQLQKLKLFYNKPIYLGFSILDISKTLMYDFHYEYMKNKFDNLKLLYTDTDSLVYQIFCDDFYKEIKEDLSTHFDTSDYPENNIFGFPLLNKKKLGLFKDEHNGRIFTEFVGLRSKMYAMKSDDRTITKSKGVNKNVTKKLSIDDYKSCLLNKSIKHAEMYRFRSLKHIIFTQKINKICLSHSDTKRYIIPNSTDTLAWGHYKIK
ncbi:hypothetical protein ABMA28_010574 [Loxostege sticticalis]|uniref:C2H2-type domain-containing protein n=1 Tax=Loxostege sticticalis TaxID=481309 RepID=A0ABD0S8P0_LOXSC